MTKRMMKSLKLQRLVIMIKASNMTNKSFTWARSSSVEHAWWVSLDRVDLLMVRSAASAELIQAVMARGYVVTYWQTSKHVTHSSMSSANSTLSIAVSNIITLKENCPRHTMTLTFWEMSWFRKVVVGSNKNSLLGIFDFLCWKREHAHALLCALSGPGRAAAAQSGWDTRGWGTVCDVLDEIWEIFHQHSVTRGQSDQWSEDGDSVISEPRHVEDLAGGAW